MAKAALDIDWEAAKLALVAGVSYDDVARSQGLFYPDGKPDSSALRQRCCRERWPVPRAVVRRAQNDAKKVGVILKPSAPQKPLSQLLQGVENGQKVSSFDENGQKVSMNQGEETGNGETGGGGQLQNSESSGERAVTLAAESLLDLATTGTLAAAQRLHRSISRAPESLPVVSVGDLATAAKALRSIAGLDKQDGPQVTVGLFSGSPGAWDRGVVTLDAETGDCDELE